MAAPLPTTGQKITDLSERLERHVAMYERALLRGNLEGMYRELAVITEVAKDLSGCLAPLVHVVPQE